MEKYITQRSQPGILPRLVYRILIEHWFDQCVIMSIWGFPDYFNHRLSPFSIYLDRSNQARISITPSVIITRQPSPRFISSGINRCVSIVTAPFALLFLQNLSLALFQIAACLRFDKMPNTNLGRSRCHL